jgi:hypothetical protein
MFDARRGAWSTFQFLIKERLDEACSWLRQILS